MTVDSIEHAEHTADRIRHELLQTLQELDRRREVALDVRYQAWRNRHLFAGIGASVAAVIGAKVLLAHLGRRRRERRLAMERRRGLRRAWFHPERLAAEPRHSRPVAFGEKLLSLTATAAVSVLLRTVIRRAID